MNPAEVTATIHRMLFPTYEEKFGMRPAANEFNVSSLVAGATDFLYWYRNSRELPGNLTPRFNRNLLRGTAIDSLAKSRLADGWVDGDAEAIRHTVQFPFKKLVDPKTKLPFKEYHVIGHFDMRHPEKKVLLELKSPEMMRKFIGDGWIARAKIQAGAYARYFELKEQCAYQAFIVAVGESIQSTELTRDEIELGWNTVLFIAKSAAEALEQ